MNFDMMMALEKTSQVTLFFTYVIILVAAIVNIIVSCVFLFLFYFTLVFVA